MNRKYNRVSNIGTEKGEVAYGIYFTWVAGSRNTLGVADWKSRAVGLRR